MAASSDDRPGGETAGGTGRAELEVDGVAMVRLLGPQDRLLTTLEREYPDVVVAVRGNHVTDAWGTWAVYVTKKTSSAGGSSTGGASTGGNTGTGGAAF